MHIGHLIQVARQNSASRILGRCQAWGVVFVVMLATTVPQARASAAPGSGVIAYNEVPWDPSDADGSFLKHGDAFEIQPDGTARTQVTRSPTVDELSGQFSSDGSRFVYATAVVKRGTAARTIWVTDAALGNPRAVLSGQHVYYPAWAPGGQRVIFSTDDSIDSIGIDGSGRTRLAVAPRNSIFSEPRSSPDGSTIYFYRTAAAGPKRSSKHTLSYWVMNADGSNQRQIFVGKGLYATLGDYGISPNGKQLAFVAAHHFDGPNVGLYTMNVDGTDLRLIARPPLTNSYFDGPTWSPDGQNIAVATNALNPRYGGELDVFQPFAGTSRAIRKVAKANVFMLGWQPLPPPGATPA